jgi:very-short-patch-repair endonuclease
MKSKYDMYYRATMESLEKAKALRQKETGAEKLLWEKLKSKQFYGFKFRRQHPISQFIVDFYCHELKLIIEVDGEIHNKPENKEYDENRTYELEKFELKVLRFTNYEVENNMDKVLSSIRDVINPTSRSIREGFMRSIPVGGNTKPDGDAEV